MKYFRVDMCTIFEDCDYSLAFAFPDEMADELVQDEIRAEFNVYMCEFSKLLGDPASYSSIDEYDQVMSHYVRNTMYKTTPITKEEFLTFENSDRVEI
jgi:hypothetical protein